MLSVRVCVYVCACMQAGELERLYSMEESKYNRAVEELQNIQVMCRLI